MRFGMLESTTTPLIAARFSWTTRQSTSTCTERPGGKSLEASGLSGSTPTVADGSSSLMSPFIVPLSSVSTLNLMFRVTSSPTDTWTLPWAAGSLSWALVNREVARLIKNRVVIQKHITILIGQSPLVPSVTVTVEVLMNHLYQLSNFRST